MKIETIKKIMIKFISFIWFVILFFIIIFNLNRDNFYWYNIMWNIDNNRDFNWFIWDKVIVQYWDEIYNWWTIKTHLKDYDLQKCYSWAITTSYNKLSNSYWDKIKKGTVSVSKQLNENQDGRIYIYFEPTYSLLWYYTTWRIVIRDKTSVELLSVLLNSCKKDN